MTIGGLGKATNTNVETVRYYERIGLLAEPARTNGGHRDYADSGMVARLAFIRRARELGFSVDDIRALLTLADGESPCGEVSALAARHLAEVRRKLADLKALETQLRLLVDQCEQNATDACPVLDALSSPRD